MSNSSGSPKISGSDLGNHQFLIAQIRDSTPDHLDDLAFADCEERKLEHARLREEIKASVADRYLKAYVVKSAERRTNCIFLFAGGMVLAQQFLPGMHPQPGLLVPLVLLAGWALRSSGRPATADEPGHRPRQIGQL